MKKNLSALWLTAFLLTLSMNPSFAQDEPLWEKLNRTFKQEYFSIGALLQVVADIQPERSFAGNNGFSLSNMRLLISGRLDEGFSYFFQTNFINTRPVLDARLTYDISPAVALDIGLFKAPFSAEFLIPASSIEMVNRSQVATFLSPGRQIGAQVRGNSREGVFTYRAGIFNGNSPAANGNDSNGFLYAGRAAFYPMDSQDEKSAQPLEIGVNVAFSQDEHASLIGGLVNNYNGERFLLGADARWSHREFLLTGEFVYGKLSPENGQTVKPSGVQVTGGYMLNPKTQALIRLDSFEFDDAFDAQTLIIFGLNLWPTKATEFQVNYLFDADRTAFDNHQILINSQIAF